MDKYIPGRSVDRPSPPDTMLSEASNVASDEEVSRAVWAALGEPIAVRGRCRLRSTSD